MKNLIKATTISSAMLLCFAAQGAEGPAYVSINSIQYAGSGCPAGSVFSHIRHDTQSVNFLFDAFVAEIGPGISRIESRKNCQLSIDLSYPQGWTYTIDAGQVSGYIDLDYRVNATQVTSYYFQGQEESASLHTNFRGPKSHDYLIRDNLSVGSEIWAPCDAQRALQINMQARLTSSSRYAYGLMTIDGPDGRDLQLKWKRCR